LISEERLAVMAETQIDQSRREFGEWASQIHGDLIRSAQRICGDPSDAEDVVQDTLVAVWKQWQEKGRTIPARISFGPSL
jgi:DNA-directed RNA polymerase specialized sigma24 family protein